MTTGASWPWNLSTVPTAHRPAARLDQRDLRVVRRDDQHLVGPIRASSPRWFRHVEPCTDCHTARRRRPPAGSCPQPSGRAAPGAPADRCRTAAPPPAPPPARDRRRLEPALVGQVGDERGEVRVHPVRAVEEDPRSGGMVAWPSSRCSSAEARLPGCTAWLGWASCCGSPSSTIDRAPAHRTALASENCPASSTTSTSTACATSRASRTTPSRRPGSRRRQQRLATKPLSLTTPRRPNRSAGSRRTSAAPAARPPSAGCR